MIDLEPGLSIAWPIWTGGPWSVTLSTSAGFESGVALLSLALAL